MKLLNESNARKGIAMKLDAGLDAMEDGFVTEAEQVDQETEIEDMQSLLDDDIMDPDSLDTDMEDAYRGFHDNKGFEGIPIGGYTDSQLEDIVRDATGLDMPEDGLHVEDGFGRDVADDDIPNAGRISDFDAEELSNDTEEVTLDEAEPIDYGFDVARYQAEDGEGGTVDTIVQEAGKGL